MTSWAYGVTTTKERLGVTLPRTLGSLLRGGFPQPRLFVDDCNEPELYKEFGLEVTCRYPRIRTYGNWALAAHELFYRNPHASHYAIFQDDLIVVSNLREYLERSDMPVDGYLNLYTEPRNEKLISGSDRWFPSNQLGKGALALVFPRTIFMELLNSRLWLERPLDKEKGYRNIDGGIVHALSTRFYGKYKEYCHNPSLVQHIGEETTIIYPDGGKNGFLPVSAGFPGEHFDALTMVSEVVEESVPHEVFNSSWATGHKVLEALKTLGIPHKRVSDWLSRPCENCGERRRRLNQLGWLSMKALSGSLDEVKERFEEVLDG